MKKILFLVALLSVVTVAVNAQTYTTQQEQEVIQSQQIMSANAHEGTIYEPFSSTTPSEQSAVGASYSPAKAPNGPRREQAMGDGRNPGEASSGSDQSPVGEPWVMAVFALVFGGVIFLRKRVNE